MQFRRRSILSNSLFPLSLPFLPSFFPPSFLPPSLPSFLPSFLPSPLPSSLSPHPLFHRWDNKSPNYRLMCLNGDLRGFFFIFFFMSSEWVTACCRNPIMSQISLMLTLYSSAQRSCGKPAGVLRFRVGRMPCHSCFNSIQHMQSTHERVRGLICERVHSQGNGAV